MSETVTRAKRKKLKQSISGKKDKAYVCSFCGKSHTEVSNLIAGPNDVCICDDCVGICVNILSQSKSKALESEE